MSTAHTIAPAKVILCGDHGVNNGQAALSTAVDIPTLCRVALAEDGQFTLRSGARTQRCTAVELADLKTEIDRLRAQGAVDRIRETTRDFFAPARYVLAHLVETVAVPGLSIEWRSAVPVSSGLGSGAAAGASMALGVLTLASKAATADELIDLAWRGDLIAHGGMATALDSSTIVRGGLMRFTVSDGAEPQECPASLALVIGHTRVAGRSTARVNAAVRSWVETHPSRMHLFRDMGHLVREIERALARRDLEKLGHLLSVHHLIQEKIGSSTPESEALIDAAMGAGALGAKISGAGGGGIIIALATPGAESRIAQAIAKAGGEACVVNTNAAGVRVVAEDEWLEAGDPRSTWVSEADK